MSYDLLTNGDNKQNEYNKGDEDVNHLIDPRSAVERDICVLCFGCKFRCSEVPLS